MDHASHLVGTAFAGEAALAVALGLARLLLLFYRGHLHGTCGHCHGSGYRGEDVAHDRDGGSTGVGVQGGGRRLGHGLDDLHGEQFPIRLILDLGHLLLLLLLKAFRLELVALLLRLVKAGIWPN